jgi:hypothetical protein
VFGLEAAVPSNQIAPQISGTAQAGQVIECMSGTWNAVISGNFTYEWIRDGLSVASGSQYPLTDGDVGTSVACRVTGLSYGGNATADSAPVVPTAAPAPPPEEEETGGGYQVPTPQPQTGQRWQDNPSPQPTVPTRDPDPPAVSPAATRKPALKGRAKPGKTLRCSAGSWTGATGKLTYAWTRNGKPIKRAKKPAYKLTRADAGKRIACTVTAKGAGGQAKVATKAVKVARR